MGYIHPSLRAKMFPDNVAAISQAIQYAKQLDPRKCDCRPLMALCAEAMEVRVKALDRVAAGFARP